MAHLDLSHLNYLAIGAAALGTFFVGAIWYAVLFRKAWAFQHGYTPEQLKLMGERIPMPLYFLLLIVCYGFAALAMSVLLLSVPGVSLRAGIHVGLLSWVIVEAFRMTAHLSSPKRFGTFLIDAGFDLIALPMIGAILGSWR